MRGYFERFDFGGLRGASGTRAVGAALPFGVTPLGSVGWAEEGRTISTLGVTGVEGARGIVTAPVSGVGVGFFATLTAGKPVGGV